MMWTSQPGWFVTINGLPLAYNNERKMTGCAEAIPAITSVLTQAQAWETPNKVYALRGSYKVAASSPIEAMRLYACSYEALDEWPRTVLIDTPI